MPRSEYVPGIGLGIAKCPYDPQDNSTAVWVESGNPGDLPALVRFFTYYPKKNMPYLANTIALSLHQQPL